MEGRGRSMAETLEQNPSLLHNADQLAASWDVVYAHLKLTAATDAQLRQHVDRLGKLSGPPALTQGK